MGHRIRLRPEGFICKRRESGFEISGYNTFDFFVVFYNYRKSELKGT